jgi:L-rhamnonate dehydratase
VKIAEVRAFEVDITPPTKTKPRVAREDTRGFIGPLSRYPDHKKRGGTSWKRGACIVKAQDGTWGFGLASNATPVTSIINDQFAPLLKGENCMATEKLWDLMNRAAAPYGAMGLSSYAVSAVDVALWDLKGKLLRTPVYELLGGPQKEKIFCYASNTDLSYGLENSLRWFLELGFKAVKVFLTHGPEEDLEGLRKNEEMVALARETVGDDVELAVDSWMGLNQEYTVRLVEALRPYRIKWLEDYLLPDDFEGYARVRARVPFQTLATGEHWYTIKPFALAAQRGLVDIFQPDVLWAGGITTSMKICHIAEGAGISVISHAGMNYPFGQHLSFAMPAIEWGERSEGVSPPGVPLEEMVRLPGTPVIEDGFLVPSDAPGFGFEITEEWLERHAVSSK